MPRLKLRRPSGRTVPWIVACVAIVLAMGGTGLAAKKYLITSTNQISPKVLAKLHGAKGARGLPGPAGAAGAKGANGANGAPGAPGAAGSAKGYAEVLITASVQTVHNVGFRSERHALAFGRDVLHRRAARCGSERRADRRASRRRTTATSPSPCERSATRTSTRC